MRPPSPGRRPRCLCSCLRGDTTTHVKLQGSREAHAAFWMVLGRMDEPDAEKLARKPGGTSGAEYVGQYVLCHDCAERARVPAEAVALIGEPSQPLWVPLR